MKSIGKIGEEMAVQFLSKNGYNILDKNIKAPFGEIDIIAEKDNCVCFVEVKSRKTEKYGLPEEAITQVKKNKIIKVAQFYIKKKHIKHKLFRFDVISINFNKNFGQRIRHIANAFSQ